MNYNANDYEEKNGILQLKNEVIVPSGKILITLRNIYTGKITQDLVNNMFVTAGKYSVAQGLRDVNKGMITYCALGTGITAPALADTQLQTEIFRKLISVRSTVNNTTTFQTFFTTSEGNGILREAGLFGDDATAISGSGILFARAAINRVKSLSDTLTLSWAITVG